MDIRRSELPLLISLDVLLEEQNVTRAARRLNISQSTLSGQLSRLRVLFGDALLIPSSNGRGMVPTPRALELRGPLGQALAGLREAVVSDSEFVPATSRRTFVIAANDNVFTIAGLSVMAQAAALKNPGLRIASIPASEEGLVERMARGEVDLFLGDAARIPDVLKIRFLKSDHFLMAQRIGHPRGKVLPTLDEYCQLQHVIVSQRAHFHTAIDDVLADLGRVRHVAMAVPSYNQVALVLAHSAQVATMPSRLLARYDSLLEVVDLPFDIPQFQFSMAWHPRAHHDPGSIWLRERFIEAITAGH